MTSSNVVQGAVLPQFVPAGASAAVLLLFAFSHAVLGLAYSLVLVAGLHRVRRLLSRRRVRRTLDTATAGAPVTFGAVLAGEHG